MSTHIQKAAAAGKSAKRFLPLLFLFALLILAGCGRQPVYMPQLSTPSPVQSTAVPTPVPAVQATPVPSAQVTPVPSAQATAAPASSPSGAVPVGNLQTPAPTQAPVSVPASVSSPAPATGTATPAAPETRKVKITKSPTSETVEEGGKAIFIAKAENASAAVWILVSPDAKTTYRLEQGPSAFPGLSVDGQGTEKIHLYNIPYSMNGWRVQCFFEGNGGPLYTSGAYLTITSQSQGTPGGSIFLEGDEQRSYDKAVNSCKTVQQYAANTHFSSSSVENHRYYSDMGFGEFQVILTRGAVKLVCTLRTYPAENSCLPESMVWYESDQTVKTYSFGKADSEGWNHLEAAILEVTNHYGDGTAGQTMQLQ